MVMARRLYLRAGRDRRPDGRGVAGGGGGPCLADLLLEATRSSEVLRRAGFLLGDGRGGRDVAGVVTLLRLLGVKSEDGEASELDAN
ncbi:hypothetical protein AAVH_01342 [Aphelenchoides avenae]|nr:hypothetical protein AAVH_01342 [Aphelenchus avenae]